METVGRAMEMHTWVLLLGWRAAAPGKLRNSISRKQDLAQCGEEGQSGAWRADRWRVKVAARRGRHALYLWTSGAAAVLAIGAVAGPFSEKPLTRSAPAGSFSLVAGPALRQCLPGARGGAGCLHLANAALGVPFRKAQDGRQGSFL